jgi:hypothetical protein
MKKKNKDLIPLLVIGAGGLYLLSGSKKTSGSSAPPPPSGEGSSAPPPPPSGGGGSSSGGSQSGDMYVKLERLGYTPRINLSTAISSFQKEYNEWKGASILKVDGKWGPNTYAAVDEVISTLGDLSKWGEGGPEDTETPAASVSGVKVYTDKDWSPFWGVHYHAGTMDQPFKKLAPNAPLYDQAPGYKEGLRESDIANLVSSYRNGEFKGKEGRYYQVLGSIYTGPRIQTRGRLRTVDHTHWSNFTISDLGQLSENKKVLLSAMSVGVELPPNDGTESHTHDLTIELT